MGGVVSHMNLSCSFCKRLLYISNNLLNLSYYKKKKFVGGGGTQQISQKHCMREMRPV